MLHGGDWNPDQWLHEPGVLEQDFALMEKAGCNTFSIGIFAWATLEPEEGHFELGWLDDVMNGLAKRGFHAFLATPSGAKPRWMSEKYEEVRRIDAQGRREMHGSRHNHCFTSPVYREKVRIVNTKLAERYKGHPALGGWHISNEYSGACYCNYCLAAFRAWLKTRYADLDALNQAYWAAFWAQKFQTWEQIDPREAPMDGLQLDWDRFVTHQTVDFMKSEVAPLKAATPAIPVTTNMMTFFGGLDYWRFAEVCDRMAWDAYPQLYGDWRLAVGLSMAHDFYRTVKGGLPFLLMESTPSNTNWQPTPRLKRPGQHRQEMLLAIGHGADATMYFQWRKSRGAFEKMHGAVVDHEGTDKTRVFQEVAAHGARLRKLDAVVGTTVRPEVAIVNDWESRWALGLTQGPRQGQGAWDGRFDKEYIADPHRPLPAVLEARDQRGRDREPLGLRRLQARRGADALHAEAGRRRPPGGVREGRRHAPPHVPLRHRQPDEHRLPGRLAGRRAARGRRGSGRRRSTRSCRTRRSGSSPRPATPWGSPASTRCASTPRGCTRRGPRSSPRSRTTSTRGCRR